MQKRYKVAIVGATGLVGRTVLKVLEEKNYPYISYTLFSSKKSAGTKVNFLNTDYIICELKEDSFDNSFDYAIFCAGSETSKKYAPIVKEKGCIVIDNSSIFRMQEDVPLVIPEVNPEDIKNNQGIIANPNCSTIQALLPIKVLDDKYDIKRISYTTYQAVSGAGRNGIADLEEKNENTNLKCFPHSIYNNCIPQIDVFLPNGYTKEEQKMIEETRKILHKPDLPINATCVRVPIKNCHSESITITLNNEYDIYDVKMLLENTPGIILIDNPEKGHYPLASISDGNNEVYVGRIRRDFSQSNSLNIWVVADNLRKGAATNAVQILEKLIYGNTPMY